MTGRLTWAGYFMRIAMVAAERSTCDRASVGCVLAKDNRVVGMGYNGSVRGTPHCDQVGHLMIDNHCMRVIHAEQNAILNATIGDLRGAIAYVTMEPCLNCVKLLLQSGVDKFVFGRYYQTDESKLFEMDGKFHKRWASSKEVLELLDRYEYNSTGPVKMGAYRPVIWRRLDETDYYKQEASGAKEEGRSR